MKKRNYEIPTMKVVQLQHKTQLLQASVAVPKSGAKFDDYEDGEFSW